MPTVGNAAKAGLQNFKLLARDLTLAPVANSRLYGRDFNQMGTRSRPVPDIGCDCQKLPMGGPNSQYRSFTSKKLYFVAHLAAIFFARIQKIFNPYWHFTCQILSQSYVNFAVEILGDSSIYASATLCLNQNDWLVWTVQM